MFVSIVHGFSVVDLLSRVSSGAKISAKSLTGWESAINTGFQRRLFLRILTLRCKVFTLQCPEYKSAERKVDKTTSQWKEAFLLLNYRANQETAEAESPGPAETCVHLKSQQLSYFSSTVSATLKPLYPA